MGIVRFTQDISPYLREAAIGLRPHRSKTPVQNVVIDGPSLVYHVFNRLANYTLATRTATSLHELPTYTQLNEAVQIFLRDLEECGARIKHIFFDGALPWEKRPTRLDRLEKSRLVLEVHRLANPDLTLLDSSATNLSLQEISVAIWQTSSTGRGRNTSLTPPFIVPAVVESLRSSRWADLVQVVPGEAESYCAPAARQEAAAVLTNDSDLVLFEDLRSEGLVLLMHTLKMIGGPLPSDVRTIEGRCWQPKDVSERIAIPSLLSLAFERAKDPSASSQMVIQRSRMTSTASPDFATFTNQFKGADISRLTSSAMIRLTNVDNRLAEVICQLRELYNQSSISGATQQVIHSMLPMLFEDPTRVSAWSYGRDARWLAYSLLFQHFRHRADESQPLVAGSTSNYGVKEFTRKGQRIAPQDMQCDSLATRCRSMQEPLALMDQYQTTLTLRKSQESSSHDITSVSWILCALHLVLRRYSRQGNQTVTTRTILQFLGLADFEKASPQRSAKDYKPESWDLVHLAANVQGMLYSLRMLKQAYLLITEINHDECGLHIEHKSILGILPVDERDLLARMLKCLVRMPPIADMMLSLYETRELFRKASRLDSSKRLTLIAKEFELWGALGIKTPADRNAVKQSMKDEQEKDSGRPPATEESGAWLDGKRRKRKAGYTLSRNTEQKPVKSVAQPRSSNPFEVLNEAA